MHFVDLFLILIEVQWFVVEVLVQRQKSARF